MLEQAVGPGKRAVMDGNAKFLEFENRFGTTVAVEVMERIAEAMWNREGKGIHFSDIHQINACNHIASGRIEHEGECFGFIIESGDINGTVIHDWGHEDDVGVYQPEPPTIYTFIPADDELKTKRPELYKVFLKWREQQWFKDKEHGYNYDRHFAPGGKTESYYRSWAASKGLKIAPKDALSDTESVKP